MENKSLWGIYETAQYLNLKPDTVRVMARQKRIPAIKMGHIWRFDPREVKQWIDEKRRT